MSSERVQILTVFVSSDWWGLNSSVGSWNPGVQKADDLRIKQALTNVNQMVEI